MAYAEPWSGLERDELPLPVAFLLSCLVSALVATLVIVCLERTKPPAPPKPLPVRVVLLQLPSPPPPPVAAAPPEALPPPATAILPRTQVGTVVQPKPLAAPLHRPAEPPRRRRPAPRPVFRHVAQLAPPAPPSVGRSVATAPVSRPAASDPAARDSLEARIRAAIRASFRFPEAAREMGAHGTAVVGFLYRDRAALFVRIARSSTSSILDQAAVQIVREADLPPPGPLAGQTLNLQVPIVFDLVSDDD